jgi:hypothetical protein
MKEEKFFEKLKEIYGDSISVVSFDNLTDKSEVLCNCEIHGNFTTTVHNLLTHKNGCPFCRLHNSKSPYKTTEQLVYKLRLKYGDKFGYEKVRMGGKTIILTCPIHGDFEVRANRALNKDVMCPKCRYNTNRQHNGVKSKNPVAYTKWNNMIVRCFNDKYHEKQPTYETCTVCEEWLDFNNFLEWFENPENGYREGYQLDKDLFGGDSKHYSPENCCFLPQTVNCMMTRGAKIRGKVKSIGVTFKAGYYVARCNFGHKEAKQVGRFDNEQDAFEAYKKAKKDYIVQLANDLYSKGEITERVYNGLLNYEIKQYD